MAYVGHRYVLPQQNSNEWEHFLNGVGEYSNWSLMSSTHLLQDVGDPNLPDHSAYNVRRQLWHMYSGEHRYAPMELAMYSHGGQKWTNSYADQPWLLHNPNKFNGVASSEVFPRYSGSTAAYAVLGSIDASDLDFTPKDDGEEGTDPDALEFNFAADGGTAQSVSLEGDYTDDVGALIDALNGAVNGAVFGVSDGNLTVQSETTGADSRVQITGTSNPKGSGVENADETGADAHGISWGYTVEEAKDRNFTFSRHTNLRFLGVDAANKTLGSGGFQVMRFWDDPDLPSYATRHAPYEYKGVGDDRVEDPGEPLSDKYARAEESNEHAHQRTQEWFGVASAKAL